MAEPSDSRAPPSLPCSPAPPVSVGPSPSLSWLPSASSKLDAECRAATCCAGVERAWKRHPHLPGEAEFLPWAAGCLHLHQTHAGRGWGAVLAHFGKQVFKNNFANLDIFLHRGHRPDVEPLGKLDPGLWGGGPIFTFDQLKHNPRHRTP